MLLIQPRSQRGLLAEVSGGAAPYVSDAARVHLRCIVGEQVDVFVILYFPWKGLRIKYLVSNV